MNIKEYTDEELRAALIDVLCTLRNSALDVKYSEHSPHTDRLEIAEKLEVAYSLLDDCLNFIAIDQGRKRAEKEMKQKGWIA